MLPRMRACLHGLTIALTLAVCTLAISLALSAPVTGLSFRVADDGSLRLAGDEAAPTGTFHCVNDGATTWCDFARAIVAAPAPASRMRLARCLSP